jgi:hypothetical protein
MKQAPPSPTDFECDESHKYYAELKNQFTTAQHYNLMLAVRKSNLFKLLASLRFLMLII